MNNYSGKNKEFTVTPKYLINNRENGDKESSTS